MPKRHPDVAALLKSLQGSDVEVVNFDGYYGDGNGRAIVTPDPPKQHKYRAQKTEVDGITFDSKAEAERYVRLRATQHAGHISDLTLQPTFVLIDGFTDSYGTRHRAITYKADFKYLDCDGNVIVEDVKGIQTPVFRLKHKLLMFRYCLGSNPQFEFRIVDKQGREK